MIIQWIFTEFQRLSLIQIFWDKSLIRLLLEINFLTTISLKRCRRELSIGFTFKNNQIMLFTCFVSIPETGIGLPKTGITFYCATQNKYKYVFFFFSRGRTF